MIGAEREPFRAGVEFQTFTNRVSGTMGVFEQMLDLAEKQKALCLPTRLAFQLASGQSRLVQPLYPCRQPRQVIEHLCVVRSALNRLVPDLKCSFQIASPGEGKTQQKEIFGLELGCR